jgi:hypothetical protein
MRLVAVSVVKNEADIIEAFVRHTAAWVDLHLLLDDDSTDGTREILQALQADGIALKIFGDQVTGHIQQARSNLLTRQAAEIHKADWILPLDADEFVDGPGRAQLEQALSANGSLLASSLPLHDYCITTADAGAELNPVIRIRHRRPAASATRKIFIPRALAMDPSLIAGKGSHALYRGKSAQPSVPLPAGWALGHFALRSPEHQLLRVARAELQKLSRGQAAAGLDVHYRLGYQLLCEDPEQFFATLEQSPALMQEMPLNYRGGSLRHSPRTNWYRVARAMFPYLEQLARSHGTLADQTGFDPASPNSTDLQIHELNAKKIPMLGHAEPRANFSGFDVVGGWGRAEGPVPEAFLPVFHWGLAPCTELEINHQEPGGDTLLTADCLTYCADQILDVELNGSSLTRLVFKQINHCEHLRIPLTLRSGPNRITFRYAQNLVTDHDSRPLGVIFLSLKIITTPASA